ncbi:MAG: SDR family NAD(P)-dependent oxidoreductase [Eubacteriales bacterium]|jgi:NAD(P)-dependent dehydrogenase (short-subunit alcohol dehydrogenase family)|nr:SDR family NAD(P)-dependent oxidoreductase [Eubacteriales bacterium]
MFSLKGKTALVTGSTQGIGKEIARCFAEHGAKVYVHGSSSIEKCQRAADEIGAAAVAVANLLQDGCADKLYRQTGGVDILVLNASVQYRVPWHEITSAEFDEQMKANVKSNFELIQKYVPHMQTQKWGKIVTVGSVQQYRPHKDMAIYAATKAAQMSLVTNLAKQLAPDGITVNNIAPGVIATPRNEEVLSDVEYREKVLNAIPLGVEGDSADCAGAALLLCSDAGRYITGIDLIVDGGMHL